MDTRVKEFPEYGFTTLVVSDLHLTEEHKVDPRYPLWKKYKTKDFFFDQKFKDWLEFMTEDCGGPIELVLNGDIFDFDSITTMPNEPTYRVSVFEKTRTLFSQVEKSLFKMDVILKAHPIWTQALHDFIKKGNKIVFVVGNHDLEMHYSEVQRMIRKSITTDKFLKKNVKFCEWFYISHEDTHIEHGNQYDPYCVCQTPITPLVKVRNDIRVRIPFGNKVTRYMVNVMGFFNPHSEENYVMSFSKYLEFFLKYLIKKQPLVIWTWFHSSMIILFRSVLDRLRNSIVDPFMMEEKIEEIAKKSNSTPKAVRELSFIAVEPAVSTPWKLAKVLWLDKAFIFLIAVLIVLQIFLILDQLIHIKFYLMLIPLLLSAPFFIFYSTTSKNELVGTKEAQEEILRWIGAITETTRVVFGHTHHVKHEILGSMEYLNPGSWSPYFEDVECTKMLTRYAFIMIKPEEGAETKRVSKVLEWQEDHYTDYFTGKKLN